jgi:hypothetical protein
MSTSNRRAATQVSQRLRAALAVVVVCFITFVAALAAAAGDIWVTGCLLVTVAAIVAGVALGSFEAGS